jgi:hypothetical protein
MLDIIVSRGTQRRQAEIDQKAAQEKAEKDLLEAQQRASAAAEAEQRCRFLRQQVAAGTGDVEQLQIEARRLKTATKEAFEIVKKNEEKNARSKEALATAANVVFNAQVMEKIKEQKDAEHARQRCNEIKVQAAARSTEVEAYLTKFSASISIEEKHLDQFYSESASVTTGQDMMLVVTDPPYSETWIDRNGATLVGICDQRVMMGGTVCVFMDWKGIGPWKAAFAAANSRTFYVETVKTMHRHKNLGFRSGKSGHKSMTEFVMIVHRIHRSGGGPVVFPTPRVDRIKAVLGPASSGNWGFDFEIDCLPVSSPCLVCAIITRSCCHTNVVCI